MRRSLFSLIRVALIDLRGGLQSFWILIACIAIGVATVAMVGAVGASLQSALARDGRLLLGGDIEFRLTHRAAEPAERVLFSGLGKVSEVVDFIGRAQSEGVSVLAMVRAVDNAYPHSGTVETEGEGTLEQQLAWQDGIRGVLVDPRLIDRLGTSVGARIRLGNAEFQIRGILHGVPDQVSQGVAIGFPLLMSTEGLAETNILQPGSLARYRYKIDLTDGVSAADAARLVEQSFGQAGWRISLPGDATEELSRYFALLRNFLTVVGLSALLVGGVGVAQAVSAYVTERQRSIATMKALGATRSRVILHFLTQILVLTLVGIVLGVVVGTAFTLLVLPLLGPMVGIPLTPTIDGPSILSSTAFGLLTGFLFGYLPLSRAEAMRPAQLFRSTESAAGGPGSVNLLLQPRTLLPMLGAVAGLFVVAVADTGRIEVVFWYAVGAAMALLMLRVAAHLLQGALRLLPAAPNAVIRNAIKAIYRPGSAAPAVILSLGLSIALLLLIALVESNLRHQLDPEVRVDAPDFLYMDLFADEVAAFKALAAVDDRIADFTPVPLVRASSFTINGEVPPELQEPPKDLTLYFGDEQPLTYSTDLPYGSRVMSGKWWSADYSGPPLVSVTEDLRALLDLKLDDQITFLIFGQPISARIASFRAYEWQRGGINFPYVLSPGALDKYPISYFGLITARDGTVGELQAALIAAYPELVFVPIEEAIDAVRDLMDTVASAISTVGGVALASGVLVIAGALAAGRRQREADSTVAKVLGATRLDLIASLTIEYGLVGGLAATLAVPLGVTGAWAFISLVLESTFVLDPLLLFLVVPLALLLTVGMGAALTWGALSGRPASFLRNG